MGRGRNLLVNLGVFALNTVAVKLVSFFMVPLYTSYLTQADFGITDMAMTVTSLLMPLATLSIADAVVRFCVEDERDRGAYVVIGLAVILFGDIVVAAALPLLDLPAFGGLGAYRWWFLASYAASTFFWFFGEVARGVGLLRLIPACAAVSSLVTAGLSAALIAGAGLGVDGYFAGAVAGPLAASLAYLTLGGFSRIVAGAIGELRVGGLPGARRVLSRMLVYSLPLVPNALFWWVGTSINRIFITSILGISASGLFAAASKVPNMLNMVYQVFQQAWQLSAFQEARAGGVERFFSEVYAVLRGGMTVAASALMLAAPLLASLLLRGSFYQAWVYMPVLLLAFLANALNAFQGTVYTTSMATAGIMRTTVAGAVASVALNAVLVPALGLHGACLAMLGGNSAVFALRAIGTRSLIDFDMQWRRFAATGTILFTQAAVMTFETPGYMALSAAALAAILALEFWWARGRLARVAGAVLARLARG